MLSSRAERTRLMPEKALPVEQEETLESETAE